MAGKIEIEDGSGNWSSNIKAGRLVPEWLEMDAESAKRIPDGRQIIKVDGGPALRIRTRRKLRSGMVRFYF